MEGINDFLNIITALSGIISLVLGTSTLKVIRKEIYDTILQSIAISIFFMVLLPIIIPYEFKTSEEYFETLLILYTLILVALSLSKIISSKLIELCKLNIKGKASGKTFLVSLFSFIFFFILGVFFMYNNYFGINVKFTEDVSAQFVDENNSIYIVKIPKDTVINLKETDIIDNSQLLKTGMNNIKFYKSKNLLSFKISKKISLKSNVELYFANEEFHDLLLDIVLPQNIGERKTCSLSKNQINLDSLNNEKITVEFLSDTKFLLTKERDVFLLQDTKVEVYESIYKTLIVLLFVLISLFIPAILVFEHISIDFRKESKKRNNGRKKKRHFRKAYK